MTKKYRPANGTDGMIFFDMWCCHCKRDDEYQRTGQNGCAIIFASMLHTVDESGYPVQWVCDDDGLNPRCTAFVDDNSDVAPSPLEPDPNQLSFFEGHKK